MAQQTRCKHTEIGEIPEDWEAVKLGGIVTEATSGFASGKRDENGIIQLRMDSIGTSGRIVAHNYAKVPVPDDATRYLLEPGDILLTNTSGSSRLIGKTALYRGEFERCTYSNHITRIRVDKERTIPHYVLYSLLRRWELGILRALSIVQAGGQKSIGKDSVLAMKIPLPPLPEQRKISSILSTVDDAIQETDEIIAETQQLKKGLMQQLLTEGIGHTKFKQTEIGEIPEKWQITDLSQVCRIVDCKHRTPKYVETGYPVVRPSDVRAGNLSLRNCKRTTFDEYLDLTSKYCPRRGDIAFSRNASFGVASYVATDEKFTIGQDVVLLTSDVNSTLFYYYVLNSDIVYRQLRRLSTGSTFRRIDLGEIRELRVPFLPRGEQDQIASILSDVDNKVEQERQRKDQLEQLKRGLMQILLTGKVRVKVD